MDFAPVWLAHLEARDAFASTVAALWQQALAETGLTGKPWYLLDVAAMFDPAPFTLTQLEAIGPYTALERRAEHLAQAVEYGLLMRAIGQGYRASVAGHHARHEMILIIHAALAELTPLPQADLERLAGLLRRLSAASLQAAEPPPKACLPLHQHLYPGDGAPVLARILHYSTDLNAYRDDAHMAVWRPYGISGLCWDAVTVLWRDGNAGLDQLVQDHQQSRALYEHILQPAVEQGWVAAHQGAYQLTEYGHTMRQAAEATTDRYFFAPWSCLTEEELGELQQLLLQLRDGLRRQTTAA